MLAYCMLVVHTQVPWELLSIGRAGLTVARSSDGSLDSKTFRRTAQDFTDQVKRCRDWQIPLHVVSEREMNAFFRGNDLLPRHQKVLAEQLQRAGAIVVIQTHQQHCAQDGWWSWAQTDGKLILVPWVTVSTCRNEKHASHHASSSAGPAPVEYQSRALSELSMVSKHTRHSIVFNISSRQPPGRRALS
jgi:hypothetical protein